MPILRPSIWPLSWAAMSSQRSARAGEAPNALREIPASSVSAAGIMVDLRNCNFNVMVDAPLRYSSLRAEFLQGRHPEVNLIRCIFLTRTGLRLALSVRRVSGTHEFLSRAAATKHF